MAKRFGRTGFNNGGLENHKRRQNRCRPARWRVEIFEFTGRSAIRNFAAKSDQIVEDNPRERKNAAQIVTVDEQNNVVILHQLAAGEGDKIPT